MGYRSKPVHCVGDDFVVAPPRSAQLPNHATVKRIGKLSVRASVRASLVRPEPKHRHKAGSLFGRAHASQRSLRRANLHFAMFASLFVVVSLLGADATGHYWKAPLPVAAAATQQHHAGLNMSVATSDLPSTIDKLAGQSINLSIDGHPASPVSADMIKGWLAVQKNDATGLSNIHVDAAAIQKSLPDIAGSLLKAPVDEVTTTHADGSTKVISTGQDGTELVDPVGLSQQLALGLLNGQGEQLAAQTEVRHFKAVLPTSFAKLLEVDLTNKRMYAYDNGSLTRTFLVSAGAPATPTVVGTYHIYAKYAVQDMRGLNADGSHYFQPHVRWINYFYKDYAVHGNYWRPLSWFGNINSSHGCVSVPDDQAQWVFNWAPVGTTVITYK